MKDFERNEDAEIAISKITDKQLEVYLSKQINYTILVEILRLKRKMYDAWIVVFIVSCFVMSITLSILFLQ